MQHPVSPSSPARRASGARRLTVLALVVCVAALLVALATVLVNAPFASAVASSGVALGPFRPTADAGFIPDSAVVRLADEDVPAVGRLDPALREAMRQAETDATADGIWFQVTSGWRNASYQQWLLDDATSRYGSEEVARQYVATPDRSRHVTGDAVDIGPLDAQSWLIAHGTRYGICQTYANERWHFELATTPGGVCPPMKADATG